MSDQLEKIISILKAHHITRLTVLGHDQIDEDSCISGLLLCEMLDFYGIQAQFKILDAKVPAQTAAVLAELGYDLEVFRAKETMPGEQLFLVDHHQTVHPGRVIGCIDHHPTQKAFDYLIYDNGEASACTKKIYDYSVAAGLEITRETVNKVAYALVIDTFDFKSPRGKAEDKVWLEEMIRTYQLDYPKMVDYALSLTDLSQALPKIAMSALKAYQFGVHQVMSTYILVKEKPTCLDAVIAYLQGEVGARGLAMWVFLTIDVLKSQTTEYRITTEGYEEIVHPKLSSRAQEIMPQIEKLLTKASSCH
ncbi:MAG: DHH family phosphoesterase [Cellulosilyticaceae bacterium]